MDNDVFQGNVTYTNTTTTMFPAFYGGAKLFQLTHGISIGDEYHVYLLSYNLAPSKHPPLPR